jgi:hypothetical protein
MVLKLKMNMTKQRLQTFQHSENRHSSCSEGLNTEIPGWQIMRFLQVGNRPYIRPHAHICSRQTQFSSTHGGMGLGTAPSGRRMPGTRALEKKEICLWTEENCLLTEEFL